MMKMLLGLSMLFSMQVMAADTYLCQNPDQPRFDYVIRQLGPDSFDFRVEKNTTDPRSTNSRWGKDVETRIIFQENLKAVRNHRGLKLEGKRTQLDLTHPSHVVYQYVDRQEGGKFLHKSYVLNCEIQ